MSEVSEVKSLKDLISKVKSSSKKRNFLQSVELYIILDPRRVKKSDININELVELPAKPNKPSKIAVIASGALALAAKKAGADRVIEPEELDSLATNKREARKVARGYDIFVAEAPLMPKIGKALGQFLGPRGKMPRPVPPTANIAPLIEKLRSTIRIRSRGQLAIACRVGDEDMSEEEIEKNVRAVVDAIEKKIPGGKKSIKEIVLKLSMGKPVKASLEEVGL